MKRRTNSGKFEASARGHQAIRSCLSGQTGQPRKALDLIGQTAKRGAHLIAFETWLPSYPAWLDVCPGPALWELAGRNAKRGVQPTHKQVNDIHDPDATVRSCKSSHFSLQRRGCEVVASSSR